MCNIFLAINSIDIFFILIIIILFLFCLFLFSVIKKLKEKVISLELENKNILERKVLKQDNIDLVSIQNISKEKERVIPGKKIEKESYDNDFNFRKSLDTIKKNTVENRNIEKVEGSFCKNSSIKNDIVRDKNNSTNRNILDKRTIQKENTFSNNNNAYQKNVLQNKNRVTSPVSISLEDSFDMNQLSFDLNEFVKKSEKVVPIIRKQSSKEDYLKELSAQMASELKPQTIELTDYEKEQEEHAIISYQELLSIKNELSIVDDEENAIDFIEDLKNLRNRLN